MYTYYSMGLIWVPSHIGTHENETANELAMQDPPRQVIGMEPALGSQERM
jgi:hypothetical protein